jgi:hypothetical protein
MRSGRSDFLRDAPLRLAREARPGTRCVFLVPREACQGLRQRGVCRSPVGVCRCSCPVMLRRTRGERRLVCKRAGRRVPSDRRHESGTVDRAVPCADAARDRILAHHRRTMRDDAGGRDPRRCGDEGAARGRCRRVSRRVSRGTCHRGDLDLSDGLGNDRLHDRRSRHDLDAGTGTRLGGGISVCGVSGCGGCGRGDRAASGSGAGDRRWGHRRGLGHGRWGRDGRCRRRHDRGRRRQSGRRLLRDGRCRWGRHRRCDRLGSRRRGRLRPRREQAERVDVPFFVGFQANPEVDTRDGMLGRAARAHRADDTSLAHGVALRDADLAEMDERDGIAVAGLDRDAAAVRRQRPRECDDASSRRPYRRAVGPRHVDASMLAGSVGVGAQGEWAENGAVGRPRPGSRGGAEGQRERCRKADRENPVHSAPPSFSATATREDEG